MNGFPISEANPPEHLADLPEAADVVVIGGGVIGVSAALFLARAGKSVVLVEKGRVAGEQSSRNWGWIRVQGRDYAEIPIAQEAQRLWQALAPELDTDIGLTRGGVAYLAESDGELDGYRDWAEVAGGMGVEARVLTMRAVQGLLPGAEGPWPGALWTASDMRAEPFLAVPALARLAAREGAQIREGCAARGLETEGGRVSAVVTEAGRIRTSSVILAGGAWSSLFLRRHGIWIPQLSVRATALRTNVLPEVFAGGAVDRNLAFRRRQDGGYTLAPSAFHEHFIGPDSFRALRRYAWRAMADMTSTRYRLRAPEGYPDAWSTPRDWPLDAPGPFEAMRVLNPPPNATKAEEARARFAAAWPRIGKVEVAQAWAGMIDVMPDVVPVVDRAEALPGLTIATGMCGHGFGIGPAFGRIAAALATDEAPGHDLARFRLSRFTDGSKLELGPEL